jgi:diaminopimelate epimerase
VYLLGIKMLLNFTKMHGCGNDFMIIDLRESALEFDSNQIKNLADYKKSVGFDQLITIEESNIADIFINIFNSDGSLALACGNGTRCVAKLILEKLNKQSITIATANRILTSYKQDHLIAVDMGKAEIAGKNIKFNISDSHLQFEEIVADLVNIGNPHIIINNIYNLDVLKYGPLIENDSRFPNKVNVNFAKILSRDLVELRTWERGAGATLACGTGACATFFLLYKQGLINKEAVIRQLGGDLKLAMKKENIIMAGEAQISYLGIAPCISIT